MRIFQIFLAILIAALPVLAQQTMDPDRMVTGSGKLPDGWQMRLDKPDASAKEVNFVNVDGKYRFTTGPAAIYYNQNDVEKGSFQVEAKFDQLQMSAHPEAYGLFIGGKDLQGEKQQYIYFLVRQDGKYLIKRRNGSETPVVVDWTAAPAVNKADGSGKTVNSLAIEVTPKTVRFIANNKEVKSIGLADLPATNGQVGLRINHNLDVQVTDFQVKPMMK